jgi:hypothetical protein
MFEVEPHLLKTISAVPAFELRELAAGMLQRLTMLDGPATVMQMFPAIAKAWHDPYSDQTWKPQ